MAKLIEEFQFSVESFHLDCTEHLSLSTLGNQMLNAAVRHAEPLGFGHKKLNDLGVTWVFSRLLIQMERYPREFDKYAIRTWIPSVTRYFTNRNFIIQDAEGSPIGYATSVWAMIDLTTRQPVDITKLVPEYASAVVPPEEQPQCPVARTNRVRVTAEEPVYTFAPQFFDIDYNGHLNSIRTIEHFLNALPAEELREHPVHRMEVAYSAEGKYHEPLGIYLSAGAEGEYAMEMRKADGTIACHCKVLL